MKSPLKSELLFVAATVLIFSLLVLWPGQWQRAAEDGSTVLYAKLRGDRDFDQRILFIPLTAQDVQDLGGWPVSRDYYGYLLHALTGAGARLIALDLLLHSPQRAYPEYDRILADYLETSGIVCLPMAFEQFEPPSAGGRSLYQAGRPSWPHGIFRPHLAGCGFSNLPSAGTIQRLPLLVEDKDTLRLSFGAEIARQFWGGGAFAGNGEELILRDEQQREQLIPLDGSGQLRINPIHGERVEQVSFVEALRLLRDQPQTIDLKGRLVFVGVTAPGLAVSKSTPLNTAMPASLLQLVAAENIIRRCWLAPLPVTLQILLIVLLCALLYVFAGKSPWWRLLLIPAGLLILLLLLGQVALRMNRILPLLYPAGAVVVTALFLIIRNVGQERSLSLQRQKELQAEMESKTRQLASARAELAALEMCVSDGSTAAKEGEADQLFARQQEIAEIESRIADLATVFQAKRSSVQRKFDILYHSESPMSEVVRMIELLSSADLTLIIQGETGTGKELVARAIHLGGSRCHAPFLAVNCSALPETLLESELFGHEKGSFTGATARRRGLFELAEGGTLFLDEISETSPAFQASLLRVLQERVVQRVGGEAQIPVNVRVIAATNRDLEALVEKQLFRQDLYYRLNGMMLTLPALRNRIMDIPLLAESILAGAEASRRMSLSAEAQALLMDYPWPGNVRELENVLRRAALLADGDKRTSILKKDLPETLVKARADQTVYLSLEEQILRSLRMLRFSHSAIALTARALGGRDRGTVTEYFRGLCFTYLVQEKYRIEDAVRALAQSSDSQVLDRVRKKMRAYIANLASAGDKRQLFKGLPQRYHPFLQQLLEHHDKIV